MKIIKDYPWEFRVKKYRVDVYDIVNPHITYLGSVELMNDTPIVNVHPDNLWGKLPVATCLKHLSYGLGV